jgi:hypothetical protein
MTTQVFTNNASSVLTTGINTVATTLAVTDGSVFPTPTGGTYFYVALIGLNVNGQESTWEIVKCTARSVNNLTVTRAQEGTTVASWGVGTRVEVRLTAEFANRLVTLTDTQTLTNKTLTNPNINGGTIDGTVIGGADPRAVSATTVSASGVVTTTLSAGSSNNGTSGYAAYINTGTPSTSNLIRLSGAVTSDVYIGRAASADSVITGIVGAAPVTTVSATGLAVTGTLSATTVTSVGLATSNGLTNFATLAVPATTGAVRSDFSRTVDALGSRSLDCGVSGTYAWLQSRDKNDYSANYSLALQPNGGATTVGGNLAVTGTVSASGDAIIGSAGGTKTITLGNPAVGGAGFVNLVTSSSFKNWQIASNQYAGSALSFVPSTAVGGTTFTTPVVDISPTGLAVSGTVSASGLITASANIQLPTDASEVTFGNTVVGSGVGAYYSAASDSLKFYDKTGGVDRMTLTRSGNLGIGVVPSAWSLAGMQAAQVKNASVAGYQNSAYYSANTYYSGGWNYVASAYAGQYIQAMDTGQHQWFTAPSGTAGAAITFTERMRLSSTGLAVTGVLSATINEGGNTAVASTITNTGGNVAIKLLGTAGSVAGAMLNARSDGALYLYQGTTAGADGTLGAVLSSTGLAVTGTVSSTGGVSNTQSANTATGFTATNSDAGSFSSSAFLASNGSHISQFGTLGSSYGVSGGLVPNATYVYSPSTAGISLVAINGPIVCSTGAGATVRTTLDASGNLGIGVGPSAWSLFKAIQVNTGSLSTYQVNNTVLASNYYYSATGDKYISAGTATQYQQADGAHIWRTVTTGAADAAITWNQAMVLNGSGNLGIGVVPSAWAATYKALQFGGSSALWGATTAANAETYLTANMFWDGGTRNYLATGSATEYAQVAGAHKWKIAPSGTAGAAITFTDAMTLDASGQLGIGVTPSAWKDGGNYQVIDLGAFGSVYGDGGVGLSTSSNSYINSSFAYTYKNTAAASRYTQTGGIHSWYTAPSGTAGAAITFTQAMTLSAAGYLLVGATTSLGGGVARAQIGSAGTTTTGLLVKSANSSVTLYASSTSESYLAYASGTPMIFGEGPDNLSTFTERMRLSAAGDLLLGNTSISPGTGSTGGSVFVTKASGLLVTAVSDPILRGYNTGGASPVMNVQNNGDLTNTNNSYGAISDLKLKENITDATPKLAGLMQVRIVNYNLKTDPAHKQIGVVAQELAQVFPGLVDESPDCEQQTKTREVEVPAVDEVLDDEGNVITEAIEATTRTEEYTEQVDLGTTTKSVKYSVFVPMLIKAMQEQQALIVDLQARLAAAGIP